MTFTNTPCCCFIAVVRYDDQDDEESDENIDVASGFNIETTHCSDDDDAETLEPRKKRGRINWITPELCAALDDGKTTDTRAMRILIAAAKALKYPVDELVLNRTSIHNIRRENRKKEMEKTQTDFIDSVI